MPEYLNSVIEARLSIETYLVRKDIDFGEVEVVSISFSEAYSILKDKYFDTPYLWEAYCYERTVLKNSSGMNTLLILQDDDTYALYLPYNTQQYPEDYIEELYPFDDMYGGHIIDVFNDPEPPPEPEPEPKEDPSYYGQYPAPNNACGSCSIDYDGLGLIMCSNCPPEPTPEGGYSSIDELIDNVPLEDYINPLRDFSIYSLDDLYLFQLDIGTAYDLWS